MAAPGAVVGVGGAGRGFRRPGHCRVRDRAAPLSPSASSDRISDPRGDRSGSEGLRAARYGPFSCAAGSGLAPVVRSAATTYPAGLFTAVG